MARVAARAQLRALHEADEAPERSERPSDLAPLLTLEEVAALLKLNPRTIRRLVVAGRLPCARIAGRLRFRPADVVCFVSARLGRR